MMNIFETYTEFFGHFDSDSTGGSLLSLLTLARNIRLKLGRQGYLLDSYLSLFLDAANAVMVYEAADNGFNRSGKLRRLCFDIIDRGDMEKDPRIYNTALKAMIAQTDVLRYQERHTRMSLLFAILSDEFLFSTVKYFKQEMDDRLNAAYDSQELIYLFKRISEAVGEPLMETLNLRLKQRFILVPLVTVFSQGVTNDLLYCLTSRDGETSKQVFQLLMDSISEDKEET